MDIRSQICPDGAVHLSVRGEIDMATVDPLTVAVRRAMSRTDLTGIVLDFAGVTFCDSSGLAALDQAYGDGLSRNVPVTVTNLQPQVRRVLELTGMLAALTRS